MKRIIVTCLLLTVPALAHAGDPVTPVKEIMDLETLSWGENTDTDESLDTDIFSAARLGRIYSKDFAAKYAAASKFPAYDTEDGAPGSPFDYDVITSSQDGCPLEDLSIKTVGTKDGVADVLVSFRLWGCADDAEQKKQVSEVHFSVIEEGGHEVIDDIASGGGAGEEAQSLKAVMVGVTGQ